ncbi:MAG: lipase [Muribaculaceae bacterium]|nr:lipase [Muribaculaceae bacterium]
MRDFAQVGRFEQANMELNMQRNDGHRVVLMGNSITEHWVEMRPDFFAQNRLIGRGISGQTSQEMLVRFRTDVLNLKPKVVVICAGTNDIAENAGPYREDNTVGNIETMLIMAKQAKVKVVLASVPPCDHYVWRPDVTNVPEKVARLNSRLQALAKRYKATWLDYFTPLVADDHRALNPVFGDDGVHPNDAGYAVMEQVLLPVIKKLR